MILGSAILCLAILFLTIVAANVFFWPKVGKAAGYGGSVAVLIPARNEEQNLAACVEAVLAGPLSQLLIYDDHSTDSTGEIALALAARDARICVLAPDPLPDGWFGKTFACSRLASHAVSEWLLFLDADARLLPDAMERMVNEANRREVTLLSCWPGFDTVTFWEKALMPMLNWVVFSLFPAPLSSMRNDSSLGIAHGACILARRDIYEKLGGHTLVRDEIFEDTRLAQIWRERGERSLALDGQEIVRVRMYSSLGEIWLGFQKNFYLAFRRESSFWLFLALHLSVFLLPFALLQWKAASAILCARALLAVRFRQTWWSFLPHPFGEAFVLALGISSWLLCRSGKGVTWKGRRYRATAR